MPLLGAHMSIAGGYYKAADAAFALDMETVQIFTKNNNQWQGKPISADDVRLFRDAIERCELRNPCAHNSYLINLASPDDVLWQKSVDASVDELQRAETLGLDGVVMHPGSYVSSSEPAGLERIITGLNEVHSRCKNFRTQFWLETTAGQGSSLGCRFEHIATILAGVNDADRLGVCVDSCHIFAAGYPLESLEEYQNTMDEFDRLIGINRIRAFHLNDSKKPLGSRVDRHENIGVGCLGPLPFRNILNDSRFKDLPMYLETQKGFRDGENLDAINLRALRSLIDEPEQTTDSVADTSDFASDIPPF